MRYCYSNTEAREADSCTIRGGTESLALMERAGAALADCVMRAAERLKETPLFVCGGGNNGGDGFAAARILSERGIGAEVLCLAKRFSPDCETEKARFAGEILGVIPRKRYRLLVDCVLGTGISRAPEGDSKALIAFIVSCGGYVISADLPSGLAENGVAFSPRVTADETVCMGLLKRCLLMCDGVDTAGRVTVADIGISPVKKGGAVWEDADVAAYFPRKRSNVNKGAFGSACILAGDAKYSGAAFLAAGACLKSGAGYTRLCVSEPVYSGAIGRLPACVLQEFRAIDGDILSAKCIAVGMGAGSSELLYARLAELLNRYDGTLILDADALNALACYGKELLKDKHCRVVITPHPKEFSRLLGCSVEEVLSDAVGKAEAFAREYGVVVVLKNNCTVICDGERLAVNPTGSPALAKGGSGDVLTGFLAGTCARGVLPFEAACISSYLLGRAGEIAARDMGEYAPDAQDIVMRLPQAILSVLEK